MKKLEGNLFSVNFFYYLEKDGAKDFFSKKEIVEAIRKAINDNFKGDDMNGTRVKG